MAYNMWELKWLSNYSLYWNIRRNSSKGLPNERTGYNRNECICIKGKKMDRKADK